MNIVTVISSAIEKSISVIKCQVFGGNDIRTAKNVMPFGFDSAIPKGYRAIYSNTANDADRVIIGVISEQALTQAGESRIYSEKADGTVSIDIILRTDGNMEIGGTGNFLTKFNELKSGFDQLKGDFNAFLLHVHGGAGTPPAPPATPSTASIDNAKADNIKTG